MTKFLLAMTLVATQAFASLGLPLYLCLGHDGSICVDFGPDACDCCQHESDHECDEHGNCGSAHCSHEHSHAPAGAARPADDAEPSALASDDCPCTHVQISAPQHAATVKSSESAADSSAFSVLAANVVTAPLVLTADAGEFRIHGPAGSPCCALALVASAVMRC